MRSHRFVGYGIIHLLMALAASAAPSGLAAPSEFAFASDMPTGPEDTGVWPAGMLATMSALEDSSGNVSANIPESSWTCSGQRRRHYKNHIHVYRMRFTSDPTGLKNRNAGSLNGIYELITGGDGRTTRVPAAWGLNRYYHSNGLMEVTYISYTSFGSYQSCNAAHPGTPGSPHVCKTCTRPKGQCCCSSEPFANSTGTVLPGKLHDTYTGGGDWYSFNDGGYDKSWHQGDCPSVTVKMTTLIDKLSDSGKCGKCSSDIHKCALCLRKLADSSRTKVFHELFHLGIHSDLDEAAAGAVIV